MTDHRPKNPPSSNTTPWQMKPSIHPAADAAYRVDPETGEVLDSSAIPETQEGELLL